MNKGSEKNEKRKKIDLHLDLCMCRWVCGTKKKKEIFYVGLDFFVLFFSLETITHTYEKLAIFPTTKVLS